MNYLENKCLVNCKEEGEKYYNDYDIYTCKLCENAIDNCYSCDIPTECLKCNPNSYLTLDHKFCVANC